MNPDALVVRMEPSLNRAIDLALGEKLLTRVKDGKLQLEESGVVFAKELEEEETTYVIEKEFVKAIGKKVSESLVSRMFK